MPSSVVYVYMDLNDSQYFVGRLWIHTKQNKDSASFEYDENWLSFPESFSLEPLLQLTEGSFHTGVNKALFGAIGDSAPDRWGRILVQRAMRNNSDNYKALRTIREVDYLLAVSDKARQGVLRFKLEKDGEFLAEDSEFSVPPLVDLPRLLLATENLIQDKESNSDLKFLLAPGSSLGGARPKASVKDKNGDLLIAKFPHNDDEFDNVLWEAVALKLSGMAGINTSNWCIENVLGKKILLLGRFDRKGPRRIAFLSAMSMLGAQDNEDHSYLEIIDAIRRYGANPKLDIAELWRRIIFNILISNTDDHLRNHAFLYENRGWKLSPAYDMNPTPIEIKPRFLTTAIDFDNRMASLDIALSVASEFGLKGKDTKQIIKEVGLAVKEWRNVATDFGISKKEIDYMSSAFEHDDLRNSL